MHDQVNGIICLEGCDAAGKTYLAKCIQTYIPKVRYVHLDYRSNVDMSLYHLAAINRVLKLAQDNLVILDRWWPTESIYGELFRDTNRDPYVGRLFHRLMLKHAGIYVICLPSDINKLVARFKASRHQYDDVLSVNNRYHDLLYGHGCDITNYLTWLTNKGGVINYNNFMRYDIDIDGKDVTSFIDRLLTRVKRCQMNQDQDMLRYTYDKFLGTIETARYLFVGDTFNKNKRSKLPCWPFFENKASSLYLMINVQRLNFDEEDIIYTNINDVDGSLNEDILRFSHLKLVALGHNAKFGLTELGLQPVLALKHPSWYKRFHLKDDLFNRELSELRRL